VANVKEFLFIDPLFVPWEMCLRETLAAVEPRLVSSGVGERNTTFVIILLASFLPQLGGSCRGSEV
jgi:metal-dependent HD superfamily phosphatase/phosphodiesterase